jgi:5-methylcytosine-specific restriction endonuclease McrA
MRSQEGRCHYCQYPMWVRDREAFAREYGLSLRVARHFQCTAEHLRPRSEGGRNSKSNIVAACLFCNQKRHQTKRPLEPAAYKRKVQSRLTKGRWNAALLGDG